MSSTSRRVVSAACCAAATLAIWSASAMALPVPSPGTPGPLAFPTFSPSTFTTPPAATRPKFRWWQPVADTNPAEIRREVKTMAGNFGGGFEQNGFPVNMNSGGDTTQFQTFADSQQFGQVLGWGSPLWSDRTETYQTAAAQDGVIGDMNEGSRWNNTVPTVYSPNQVADAQDLSYGVRQVQPGQNPSGELPTVTAPALGGESTSLSRPAHTGDTNLQVQSIAGLLAGDQVILGQGAAAETARIKRVGTASPEVPLSQPAGAGSKVVHVAPGSTATGVPGSAQTPAQFVAGDQVTIGSGATAQKDTIASVGTYDETNPDFVPFTNSPVADWIWNTSGSDQAAATGTIYLRRTFTTPAGVTQAWMRMNADDAQDSFVNGHLASSSSGTDSWKVSQNVNITKDLAPAGQTNVIAVAATNSGSPAGLIAAVQIDGSNPQRIVTDTTWKAWPASTANPNVSDTPPAGDWTTVGFDDSSWENAFSAGAYGISPWNTTPDASGAAPTQLALAPGASGTIAAPAGATNVEVASTTNFLKGDTITIGTGAAAESRTITSVGAAGSGTTLSAGANGGGLQVSVASTGGLQAGQYITIGQGSGQETDRIATVSGNALTLYTPLQSGHGSGDPVAVKSIGVTFTPALSHAHDVGDTAIDSGTGITLSTPLANEQPTGATFIAGGTGLTLAAPLGKDHAVGANDATATTLAAAPTAGATNIKLASVDNLAPGDMLTVGQAGYAETVTIKTVGTAGATGTGVTFTPALSSAHDANDPVIDSTDAAVTNPSGGLSDIETESLVAAELVQCLAPSTADAEVATTTSLAAAAAAGATTVTVGDGSNLSVGDPLTIGSGSGAETRTLTAINGTTVTLRSALAGAQPSGAPAWDTCTTAESGRTRELDPATTIDVTGQVKANALKSAAGTLHYGGGTLPTGNGQPWELIDFYGHGDTQTGTGGTATTPNQWLGHLSTASADAMAEYFDDHILNDPATRAAIAYQDKHSGTPAAFEDSLENSDNLNWVPNMVASWRTDLGYNPTSLLPALAATGKNATETPAFDFPQSDGRGATLGWRVRDDYGQMFNNLYINDYQKTLDSWATSHGLVARFQSYGDPIDEGEASANEGIAETEHLETAGNDETQQFKVAASGTYQDLSPHFLSDECCEADGQAWADPFGIDGTGDGTSPDATENNAQSVYVDEAGGDSQIVYHGWPYTIGAAGSSALWPGNTYGGDTSFAAGNGPNQPQFSDDRGNNVNVARRNVVLRQGGPAFDVAVFHEDFGLTGQGQDTGANGWNLGTAISGAVSRTPTSGKLIQSSSSLAQAGYLYGYVSPAFFRYPTARFAVDPKARQLQDGAAGNRVLFPGHGDYKSLVLYDQSVMPVDVAQKIAALSRQGVRIVIVGQVPNAAPSATGGDLDGMRAADSAVRAAMATVTAQPTTKVVADATASNSQSSDMNAPAALRSLGITASTQLNTPSVTSGQTAIPVLGVRRHAAATDTDYYQLLNQSSTATIDPSVTLSGHGRPYLLNTWSGAITPIANYTSRHDRVTLSLRLGPTNAEIVAISPTNLARNGAVDKVHATRTTANATQAGTGNVVYDGSGRLVARAAQSGRYRTTLSNGTTVRSTISVPNIADSSTVSTIGGVPTLTHWRLSVDSWTQTPSGNPTQTLHTPIPATGSLAISPLRGVTNGALPSWTAITPQEVPGLNPADNLTNAAGVGTYTTTFTLPGGWSKATAGAYLNVGAAVDTVDIWVNDKRVTGVDQNDRNQVDVRRYLIPGTNTLKITVATPLRNAVAVAPATPATGQVPNSAETIGALQGGGKLDDVGLIGPVTLTPYGQSAPLDVGGR
jgi:hypothetical protein